MMTSKSRRTKTLAIGLVGFCVGVGSASVLHSESVVINWIPVSCFKQDGETCVKVRDVARALHQEFVCFDPGRYAVLPPAKLPRYSTIYSGEIGQTVSDGQIGVTLSSVTSTKKWLRQYRAGVSLPKSPQDKLIVASYEVLNLSEKPVLVSYLGGAHTGLSDSSGQFYQVEPDISDGFPYPSERVTKLGERILYWPLGKEIRVIPNGSYTFNLIFEVPREFKYQQLTYEPLLRSVQPEPEEQGQPPTFSFFSPRV